MSEVSSSVADVDSGFIQPAPSDPVEAHDKEIDWLNRQVDFLRQSVIDVESAINLILKHLDPSGTSRSLFPADKEGEHL